MPGAAAASPPMTTAGATEPGLRQRRLTCAPGVRPACRRGPRGEWAPPRYSPLSIPTRNGGRSSRGQPVRLLRQPEAAHQRRMGGRGQTSGAVIGLGVPATDLERAFADVGWTSQPNGRLHAIAVRKGPTGLAARAAPHPQRLRRRPCGRPAEVHVARGPGVAGIVRELMVTRSRGLVMIISRAVSPYDSFRAVGPRDDGHRVRRDRRGLPDRLGLLLGGGCAGHPRRGVGHRAPADSGWK